MQKFFRVTQKIRMKIIDLNGTNFRGY